MLQLVRAVTKYNNNVREIEKRTIDNAIHLNSKAVMSFTGNWFEMNISRSNWYFKHVLVNCLTVAFPLKHLKYPAKN